MIVYKIYRILTNILIAIIPLYVRKRIKNGKEDNERILERYGQSNLPRNKGKVIWFHAASIGETYSGLSVAKFILKHNTKIYILFTTTTLSSAKILENNAHERVIHQFLPIDVKIFVKRFLKLLLFDYHYQN